jgi:hypothetical protein
MSRLAIFVVSGAIVGALANPCFALCIYNGRLYAKTTIAQEVRDSKWVVRAKLISADNHWSDEDDSWTLYHVQTIRSYKGRAPHRLAVFTYRDSGGFYLDKGTSNDLGGEYLLFLIPAIQKLPPSARGASQVNYSCGQSKPWAEVTEPQAQALAALPQGRSAHHSRKGSSVSNHAH